MGARLYNTEKIVEEMLYKYPDTRSSDDLLYLTVCKHVSPNLAKMTLENALLQRNNFDLPNYKSVERSRRKLQAKNPELRANEKVEDMRYENWKEYREYALEDK